MLSNAQKNRLLLGVIVVAIVGVGAIYYLSNRDPSSPSSTPMLQPSQTQPTQVQNITPGSTSVSSSASAQPIPQPSGPVPEGKIWSAEHGHWHNLPGSTSVSSPAQLTPQPPGPVPEGKIWSAKCGHWHDLPGSTSVSSPAQLTPQPSGPVPEGKIWSAEHGHWHDAPNIKVVDKDKANQPDSQ